MFLGKPYDRPEIIDIVNEIVKDIVPVKQRGTNREETIERFEKIVSNAQNKTYRLKDFDYILFYRQQGYLTETGTDIIGLEVHTIGKDRKRAAWLMSQVEQAFMAAPCHVFKGFLIDNVFPLSGPDDLKQKIFDDSELMQKFEFHIRVNWKE